MGITSAPSMRVVAPLMFLVAFADSLVYAITAPVIPHVGREVGMTDTSILAAFFGIGAAATLPLRVWMLKHTTPRVMILAGLAIAGVSHGLFMPMDPAILFVLRFFHGVATGMIWMGILTAVLSYKNRGLSKYGAIMGIVGSAYAVGNVVTLASGFVVDYAAQLVGILYLVTFCIIAASLPKTERLSSSFKPIGFSHPKVVTSLVIAAVTGATLGLVSASLPVIYHDHHSPATIGVVYAAAALPGVLLTAWAGKRIASRAQMMMVLCLPMALAVSLAVIYHPNVVVIAMLFIGLVVARTLISILQSVSPTLIMDAPQASSLVLALAVWGILFDLAYAAGPALASLVAMQWGMNYGIWVAVGVTFALGAMVVAWTSMRYYGRRDQSAETTEAQALPSTGRG